MIKSYILKEGLQQSYMQAFNDYAMDILYGGNIVMGSDIEDEWKDVPVDD